MHPNAGNAREALNNAVNAGHLIRQPCFICGELKTEGHHPDYDQPLSVVWLCVKHHKQCHPTRGGERESFVATKIIHVLGDCIKESKMTYDLMHKATGVNRATLCRLAQRKVPLLSVELASRIAPAFGYELRLVRKRK
jgi:hypothetical protein